MSMWVNVINRSWALVLCYFTLLMVETTAASSPEKYGAAKSGYDWDNFPAAWFGANATNWESLEQIAEIGRYSLAILGWQHLSTTTNFTDVVYAQLAQAAIIKAAHPNLPVYVYCSFGWAFGQNAAVYPIMNDPAYKDFFLQSNNGAEFSDTDCQQTGKTPRETDGRCVGYFWNMANSTARDYFVKELVTPLAVAPMIDGVFYDAFNYGYDIPEVRPWGKVVTNVPNCTNLGGSGCEALLNGTLDTARRTALLLNAHNKVPMFANPATFVKPPKQNIWLDEARLVKAMDGCRYQTYYESFRAESAQESGLLANILEESKQGVAAGVHTYYPNATENPMAHMAAFLLGREEGWYFFGSTGWWDDSYHWSDLYDKASKCGKPLGPASAGPVYTRKFEGCSATLDCTRPDWCKGEILFESLRERLTE